MILSIAEIVEKACELKTKEEKIEWLKKNTNQPLRNILSLMYNKHKFEFNIPTEAPPYTSSDYPDSQGMLYKEARKLKYFVKGFGGENLTRYRREALFIQMLESVDSKDAILLCKMIAQKPLKGLTADVINSALGDVVEKPTKKATKTDG